MDEFTERGVGVTLQDPWDCTITLGSCSISQVML